MWLAFVLITAFYFQEFTIVLSRLSNDFLMETGGTEVRSETRIPLGGPPGQRLLVWLLLRSVFVVSPIFPHGTLGRTEIIAMKTTCGAKKNREYLDVKKMDRISYTKPCAGCRRMAYDICPVSTDAPWMPQNSPRCYHKSSPNVFPWNKKWTFLGRFPNDLPT